MAASSASSSSKRVLVVGGGPVGLITALGLASKGVPVLVIEKEAALTQDLRAGSFHPPTMEMMAPLGITERFLKIGIQVPRWQIRDKDTGVVAEFDLGLLKDITPHPYRFHCEQFKLTPIAYDLLRQYPHAEVRFNCSFESATQTADKVVATVTTAEGKTETIEAAWLVGADGGRSNVRKTMGVEFPGMTWPDRFLVTGTRYDLAPHGYTPNAYIADPKCFSAIFQMPYDRPPGLWRVLFSITDPDVTDEALQAPDNIERLMQSLVPRQERYDIVHTGIYKVHQRVATTFRQGRILLAGDAAHVNNPLGAMGLNGGIHDACNLYPKLAAVFNGEADAAVLDRYVRQRHAVQVEFVQELSTRNKKLLEERDPQKRAEALDQVRRTVADPKLARDYLIKTSMIASVKRAEMVE
jgi:3-(3-hydroxy-phenyl)propionate hydroxylase